ncbi:transposase [Azospirillum halopraeferens]|uniref:transposase n=1 Tax=Azospirillum halopraeferens TaxID=34010 RepID=UPI0009FE4C13
MLALLICAYSRGVRSSRVIERLCRRDDGYRFFVGEEVPDHSRSRAMVCTGIRKWPRHIGRYRFPARACRSAGL